MQSLAEILGSVKDIAEVELRDEDTPEEKEGNEETLKPVEKRRVSMSNSLTRAAHHLSLTQKRIITLGLSRIKSWEELPQTTGVFRTVITANEYAALFNVTPQTAYEQLQEATDTLFDQHVEFIEFSTGNKKIETKVKMRWVQTIKYSKGSGQVELLWNNDIVEHIYGLKEQFTSYQIKLAAPLKSVYSWRLLELLMSFKSLGEVKYPIDKFNDAMDVSESRRKNFADIQRRIIVPAITELKEKCGLNIDVKRETFGRKVTHLVFKFDFSKIRSLEPLLK